MPVSDCLHGAVRHSFCSPEINSEQLQFGIALLLLFAIANMNLSGTVQKSVAESNQYECIERTEKEVPDFERGSAITFCTKGRTH